MRSLSIWSLSNHFLTKVFPSIKSNKRIKIVSVLTNKKQNQSPQLENNKYVFPKHFQQLVIKRNSERVAFPELSKHCDFEKKRKEQRIVCFP